MAKGVKAGRSAENKKLEKHQEGGGHQAAVAALAKKKNKTQQQVPDVLPALKEEAQKQREQLATSYTLSAMMMNFVAVHKDALIISRIFSQNSFK